MQVRKSLLHAAIVALLVGAVIFTGLFLVMRAHPDNSAKMAERVQLISWEADVDALYEA